MTLRWDAEAEDTDGLDPGSNDTGTDNLPDPGSKDAGTEDLLSAAGGGDTGFRGIPLSTSSWGGVSVEVSFSVLDSWPVGAGV